MDDPSNGQKHAEAYRNSVEPLYGEPLYEQIGGRLPLADQGTQLVAEARCGYLPVEIRPSLDDDVRMIALDPSRAMLDLARERAEEAGVANDIFFIPERVDAISYADGVFQSSICLEGMITGRQAQNGLDELSRVTVDDGTIAVAFPLATSFEAFYDLLDEALRAHEMVDRFERVEDLRETLLSPARLMAITDCLGLDVESMERIEWSLEFERGRDFLHAPVVRETFFPHWIGVISSPNRDQVMRYIGDAIDTYWRARTFRTSVRVAYMVVRLGGEDRG